MARRNSKDGDGLDFKAMMENPFGKWLFAPAIMAVLAIAAWGLVLTMLQLQDGLPSWVYSAPGLPTVAIYYTIQLRKAWHLHIKPEITLQKDSKGVAKQAVKGNAIVPNIQGDHNVIHQTIIQHQAPPSRGALPSPDPTGRAKELNPQVPDPRTGDLLNHLPPIEPAHLPPVFVNLTQVSNPVEPSPAKGAVRTPSVLHDADVKVPAASHEAIPFDLTKGDVLKGALLGDATFFAFVLSERAYNVYWKSREPGSARMLCDDDLSAQFRWTAPRTGRFFLVLDTYGKQTNRRISVRIEKLVPIVA